MAPQVESITATAVSAAVNARTRILNDEPCTTDGLDRLKFARALGNIIGRCDTPLVLGLYGTWGVGKTSLMRLIQQHIEESGTALTIWFDAWQHQFDENPAVALLHTMVDKLGLGEEGRKLLYVISSALGALVLKATTTLSTTDIQQLEASYEQERFRVRERQVKLRDHFANLLAKATRNGEIRLVFFIDDLDRCMPENVLSVLEALKLFLNMPGCVYVLGVDRTALESSINHRYESMNVKVSEADYLDKIVQLPFVIPPVSPDSLGGFIEDLLPAELRSAVPDLIEGLGDNPRQVKRFINSFLLNDELAREVTEAYDARRLAQVLLLQYRSPEVFKSLSRQPGMLAELSEADFQALVDANEEITKTLQNLRQTSPRALYPYILLSEAASVRDITFEVTLSDAGPNKVAVIKTVRDATGVGLKEGMDLVDAAPATIATGLDRESAEKLVTMLRLDGAQADLS